MFFLFILSVIEYKQDGNLGITLALNCLKKLFQNQKLTINNYEKVL